MYGSIDSICHHHQSFVCLLAKQLSLSLFPFFLLPFFFQTPLSTCSTFSLFPFSLLSFFSQQPLSTCSTFSLFPFSLSPFFIQQPLSTCSTFSLFPFSLSPFFSFLSSHCRHAQLSLNSPSLSFLFFSNPCLLAQLSLFPFSLSLSLSLSFLFSATIVYMLNFLSSPSLSPSLPSIFFSPALHQKEKEKEGGGA